MNKSELIDKIALDTGINKKKINLIIDQFTKITIQVLKMGGRMTIVGFGSFYVNTQFAKNGRNPQTGEKIKIEEKKVPKFKASRFFLEKCNS